jgi:hypothetical protein
MSNFRLFLFIFLFLSGSLCAQNPRLAMYESSPMVVNPAWTGKFNGKIQVGAHTSLMRFDNNDTTQDPRMMHNNFSIEYRSKYDKEDRRNLKYYALGLNYYRYGHSTAPFNASFISLSGAYHSYLDRRRKHNFSAGAQITFARAQINPVASGEKTYYNPEISGGGFAYRESEFLNEAVSHSYPDFNVGINYMFRTQSFSFETGLSMYHMFYPRNDIFQKDLETKLRHRGVFSMNFAFDLDDVNTILFKTLYWTDGLYWLSSSAGDRGEGEYKIAGWLGFEFVKSPLETKLFRVNYGLHTRSLRTMIPMVSAFYNDQFNLRACYETPINSRNFEAYRAKRFEVSLFVFLNPAKKIVPYTED